MLFNSFEFIFVFLPITFFIYFYLNKKHLVQASKGFLVFSSLFFYSWWNINYLPIILASMLFNYSVGKKLSGKKSLLIFGLIMNLSLLAYFKYMDFFIENINLFSGNNYNLIHLALPLAISFFTFQQISYLVDSYQNRTKEYDFLNYALFVTFFPQLIAGPIVHHQEMMPQFAKAKNKVIQYKNIALGIFIFSIGLFKKVVIADTFSVFVTKGFDTAETLNMIEAWIASLSYTFQIYFDFSGYTDMAIGAALLFNISLPINFFSPYKARNIQEFWKRWHITLSRFLKDYLYIPLGGNRKGSARMYSNLMLTFLIGGFWHGAGWTFVFWGFLHGFALSIQKLWSKLGFKMYTLLAWFITFNFVNITWVFFRAKEWDDAIKVLKGMLGMTGIGLHSLSSLVVFAKIPKLDLAIYLITVLFAILVLTRKNSVELSEKFTPRPYYLFLTVSAFLISVLFMNSIRATEFLYFDF